MVLYEHFHKIATAHGEEGYTRFTGYSLGKKRLTCSRRTYQQSSLGNLTSQLGVFLRILQEFNNFLYFLFCTFLAGYVFECDIDFAALLVHLGLALSNREDAASPVGTAATHSVHDKNPEKDEQCKRCYAYEKIDKIVAMLVLVAEFTSEFTCFTLGLNKLFYLVDASKLHIDKGVGTSLVGAGAENFADVLFLNEHPQFALILVGYDFAGKSFLDIYLKLAV